MKNNHGFSLVENLCILGVILIIFVVFFRTYINRNHDIKYQKAQGELAILNCALENYNKLCGTYPMGNFETNNQNAVNLYAALSQKSQSFLKSHKWKLSNEILIDPWGNPYVYKYSGNPDDNYVLFSMGPNGYIDNKELIDDIYSR